MEGTKALQEGRYDVAVKQFEMATKLKPDFAPAYTFLGLAYKGQGKDAFQVMSYFEKSIELDHNYAVAYENLGKAYYSFGNNEKALKYCLKANQLDPTLMTTQLTLGWIYLLGQAEPKNAIKYFKKVVEQNKMPYAYLGLGIAYFQDGQIPLVLEMITSLRQMGEEKYASHLESMIRQGRFIPPVVEGMKLEVPQRNNGVLVRDENVSYQMGDSTTATNPSSAIEDVKNMPVKLRAKLPSSNQDQENPWGDSDDAPSGTQRIQELQRNGQAQSPFHY